METADIAIIASTKDMAGMNIARQLQKMQKFPAIIGDKKVALHTLDKNITQLEDLDKEINAQIFIFASKHVSKAGVHSLTVHSIGNWSEANAGGKNKTLVAAPAILMKECFRLLNENASQEKLDHEVVQEATHHGPHLEKPAMFIEIGSDEERWQDETAGKVVARAILKAIQNYSGKGKSAVALGGLHYCTNFSKVSLNSNLAIGIVCPKHHLASLDEQMLRQAMDKSVPKAEVVVLDWKGMGTEKDRVVKLLESAGIPFERTRDY